MITARDNMDAHLEQVFHILLGDALPFVRIFTVRNAEVDLVFLDVLLQERRNQCESWFSVDVTDEEYIQMLWHKCSPGISKAKTVLDEKRARKERALDDNIEEFTLRKKGVHPLTMKRGDRFERSPLGIQYPSLISSDGS